MATMTPREQIEVGDLVRWEHQDRTKWAEGRLVRLYTPVAQPCADIDVQSSNFLPAGEMATLGLGCEAVFCRILSIRTPVGDIPVRADPALKPDEFRMDSGGSVARVIGVDFGSEPSTTVIFHKCGRCEQTLDFGDADPIEIAIMKRGHDMICPARNGAVNGVFHIDPDPPGIKERQLDRIAERQRDEALRAGWDGRNWCWCGCASSVGQCPNATCTRHRLAHLAQSRFAEPGAGSFDYAAAFRGVDRSESPERLSGARNHRIVKVDHGRPDGFAQSKIDEIKAMLTAPVKGKR